MYETVEFIRSVMWWSLFFAVSTWISLIALAGWVANDKGRDPAGFMLAAFFFPLAGVIAACACRQYPKREPEHSQTTQELLRNHVEATRMEQSGTAQERYERYQASRQQRIEPQVNA